MGNRTTTAPAVPTFDASQMEALTHCADSLLYRLMSNLYWVAALTLTEYGVDPTRDEVLNDAFPAAVSFDSIAYNREQEHDSYAAMGDDSRKGLSGVAFQMAERNALEAITLNAHLVTLRSMGITPTRDTADVIDEVIVRARESSTKRKLVAEAKESLRRGRMKEAASKVATGF